MKFLLESDWELSWFCWVDIEKLAFFSPSWVTPVFACCFETNCSSAALFWHLTPFMHVKAVLAWFPILDTASCFHVTQQPHKLVFQCQPSAPGRFGHYIHLDSFAEGDGPLYAIFRGWESFQALTPGRFRNSGRRFAPVGIVSQQQSHFNLTWLCGKKKIEQSKHDCHCTINEKWTINIKGVLISCMLGMYRAGLEWPESSLVSENKPLALHSAQ